MSEPFLGEVRPFGFDFPPRGWARCDGQLLPIAQNQALYSLLGTTYGGDGRTNFALPDLRSRVPIHETSGVPLGRRAGTETATLSSSQMPSHSHSLNTTSIPATGNSLAGNVLAKSVDGTVYADPGNLVAMSAAVQVAGGGQAHDNMQPFLTINYCIALSGLFPSRN